MLDCTRLFECDRPKQARAYFSRHSRTNIFVLLMVLLLLLLLLLLHHIVKWCDKRPPENVGVCRCGAVKLKLWGAPSSLVLEDQQGNVIDWNVEYKGNYVVLRLTNMNKSMPDTNTNIHLFIGHPFNHWPTNQSNGKVTIANYYTRTRKKMKHIIYSTGRIAQSQQMVHYHKPFSSFASCRSSLTLTLFLSKQGKYLFMCSCLVCCASIVGWFFSFSVA